jgi:hypothetical protein
MRADELVRELKRRGRTAVYHACTLGTFRSYCELGGYRSRAAVQTAGLPLTPQASDHADQRIGVWDHLFLNLYDQHGDVHKGRSVTGLNKYGPLLMELSVDSLVGVTGEIIGYRHEIARDDYDPETHDVKTIEDLREEAFRDATSTSTDSAPSRRPGTRGPNMCVHVRDNGYGIQFQPHLLRVVVDQLPSQFARLQSEMLEETNALVAAHASRSGVKLRQCIASCGCRDGYASMSEDNVRVFIFSSNVHVYEMKLPRQSKAG